MNLTGSPARPRQDIICPGDGPSSGAEIQMSVRTEWKIRCAWKLLVAAKVHNNDETKKDFYHQVNEIVKVIDFFGLYRLCCGLLLNLYGCTQSLH